MPAFTALVLLCRKRRLRQRIRQKVTARHKLEAALRQQSLRDVMRIQPLAVLNRHDVHDRGIVRRKDAPVIRPRPHQHSKARHLRGTVVDVEPEEILLQNQPRNVPETIAPLLIDRLEEIIGFDKDMAGAAGRIDQGEVLGIEFLGRDLRRAGAAPLRSARPARCNIPSAP